MSAAVTAAAYLYSHGHRSVFSLHSHRAAEPPPARRPDPVALEEDQSRPVKQAHTPKIEYRKRRSCLVPLGADSKP